MIIAISGKKESGKTTTAKFIQQLMKENQLEDWKIKSFAEYLKKFVSNITGIEVTLMNEPNVKRMNFKELLDNHIINDVVYNTYKDKFNTLRDMLVYVGTDIGRDKIHQDLWVTSLLKDYNENSNWIIQDLRFDNEYEILQSHKAILLRVQRYFYEDMTTFLLLHPDKTVMQKAFLKIMNNDFDFSDIPESIQFTPLSKQPLSETDLDNHYFDCVLHNTHDEDFLKIQIESFLIDTNLIK